MRKRPWPASLDHGHAAEFVLTGMRAVRRAISMPAALARRIEREARRRKSSFSAIVPELVEQAPGELPYAGVIDDDPDLSLRVDEVLSRVDD